MPSPENPLLDFTDLPDFGAFDPTTVSPAIDQLLKSAHDAMDQATKSDKPASWANVVDPLERAVEHLSRAWGIVNHLSAVNDSEPLRQAYGDNLPKVTAFWTELSQNRALFQRYQALRDSDEFEALSASRQQVIEHALRDFRLGGAQLESPERERFAQIQQELASLQKQFADNVLDSTNAFELLITDETRLAGLPDDAIQAARADAQAQGQDGYRFTLQFPSYMPVMRYASDRELREQMYRAYGTRASELAQAPSQVDKVQALDNSPVIDRLLALRAEQAALLGFDNFAQVSLAPKMARTPQEVVHFLRDLAARARPAAQRDLAARNTFAAQELGIDEPQSWDARFVSEKLRESQYDFSDQTVKQYFQLPRVLQGLFAQVESLFDVTILPDEGSVWHDTVQLYRIERDGQLLGQFFTDLFARESKRPGAWMDGMRSRARRGQQTQTPVAYLVCNFQPPVHGKPALLTHSDVQTLFHEFGHGLHHLLTQVDDLAVSGISGVEWDAVELPSQFMENFCWEWPIVESMTAHVETGNPLPRELFDKMLAAKNFQAALYTLRQVEYALFDMLLHDEFKPGGDQSVQDLLQAVRDEIDVAIDPPFNRFQNSFSHIFAGGYSAGYYSYKWAEVLSADAYSAFEQARQAGDPAAATRETGRRFLKEILSVGGSRPAIDSFRAFMGRDPDISALLRHNGINEDPTDGVTSCLTGTARNFSV